MLVAGDPLVADVGELPALVQRRVVDKHVGAAEHILPLDDVEPVVLKVGQDHRLLGRQALRGLHQAAAIDIWPRLYLHH
jgi:hypothetical protein